MLSCGIVPISAKQASAAQAILKAVSHLGLGLLSKRPSNLMEDVVKTLSPLHHGCANTILGTLLWM